MTGIPASRAALMTPIAAPTSETEIAKPSTRCVIRSWMICTWAAGSCSIGPR
jgi:hypothetical protein